MLGLAQSGLPATAGRLAPGRRASRACRPARAHAEALLDADGRHGRRRARRSPRSSSDGWLRRVAGRGTGERRVSRPWLTPAGSSPGPPAGSGSRRPATATRPLGDRVKQTLFAILEPDLRDAPRPRPVRRQRRGRDRGAVARCGARDLRRARQGGRRGHRGEPRHGPVWPAGGADRPRRGPRLAARARGRRGRPVRRRHRRPAVRRDRRCSSRRSRRVGPLLAPRRPRRRQALLARPAAGQRRAASIRARAPLRRDDADLLPARGGCDEHDRGLSRLVRPDHQRPPRHRRRGPRPSSTASSSPSWPTRGRRRCCRSRRGSRVIRDGPRRRRHRRRPRSRSSRFDGLTVDFCRARGAERRSSAACARSATSRPRCSSPTTTACWRRTSTRSSS